MEKTACGHEGCGNPATEVVLNKPGEAMVLDGATAATFLCGQDGHTSEHLQEQILRYDTGATLWVFKCAEPISGGQVFAALATTTAP